MTTKHYVTSEGVYIGGFGDGAEPPAEAIEVAVAPDYAAQLWLDGAWLAYVPTKTEQEAARKAAYIAEADPIFFMSQRGEATTAEWEAKVAEIKARFPYPTISA